MITVKSHFSSDSTTLKPMPRLPPVITATRPAWSISSVCEEKCECVSGEMVHTLGPNAIVQIDPVFRQTRARVFRNDFFMSGFASQRTPIHTAHTHTRIFVCPIDVHVLLSPLSPQMEPFVCKCPNVNCVYFWLGLMNIYQSTSKMTV